MNKNEKQSLIKGKGAAVGIVVCFVAVIAAVGTYTFNNYQNKLDAQLAKNEELTEQITEERSQAAATDEITLPEAETDTSEQEEAAENQAETQTTDFSASGTTQNLWFSEESLLDWPASGAILINYSMDKTTYFSTLEQYKYNPALIIGGKVGEYIGASASGIVTNVEQNAQTGLTVTLDMGNGYSAVYGQLKEVPVEVDDYVKKGQIVGYLSEPTKYYSVEGPNLYFQVLKDGEPVNPLDFMEN